MACQREWRTLCACCLGPLTQAQAVTMMSCGSASRRRVWLCVLMAGWGGRQQRQGRLPVLVRVGMVAWEGETSAARGRVAVHSACGPPFPPLAQDGGGVRRALGARSNQPKSAPRRSQRRVHSKYGFARSIRALDDLVGFILGLSSSSRPGFLFQSSRAAAALPSPLASYSLRGFDL